MGYRDIQNIIHQMEMYMMSKMLIEIHFNQQKILMSLPVQ